MTDVDSAHEELNVELLESVQAPVWIPGIKLYFV
jgi:hypothetical protein